MRLFICFFLICLSYDLYEHFKIIAQPISIPINFLGIVALLMVVIQDVMEIFRN